MRKLPMKRRIKAILPLLLILVSAAAAELLLANFAFIKSGGNASVRDFAPNIESYSMIDQTNSQLSLGGLSFEANSVKLETAAVNDPSGSFLTTVTVYTRSDGGEYAEAVSKRIAVGGEVTLRFDKREAENIVLTFDSSGGDFYVGNVTVNPSYSLRFSFVRFAIIALAAALACILIKNGKRIRGAMTEEQAKTLALAVCVAACTVFSCMGAAGESSATVEYSDGMILENCNPYIQQFDAFKKGQLHIDIQPMPELLELENPYDPARRDGIYYLWDRALYNGKYYSYFGVTPILTVYYPFYLITHSLPNEATVKAVYSLMTAFLLPLAVFELAKLISAGRRLGKEIPPWMTAVAAIGTMFASLTFLMQRGNAQFYYIAVMAANAFLSLFAFLALRALNTPKTAAKLALLAGAGVAFGLGFHARVNTMLPAAALAVTLVTVYFIRSVKSKRIGRFFACAAALGLPVAAAIALSFAYNYARFGDILEFGTSYQLTVADTSLYALNLGGIVPTVFYYFLQPLRLTADFPFAVPTWTNIGGYDRILYVDQNLGIFTMPFNLLILGVLPLLFVRKATAAQKSAAAVGLAAIYATAFADFCRGGVIYRYIGDISLSAALLSAFVLLLLLGIAEESRNELMQKALKWGGTALCAVTVVVSLAVSFTVGGNFTQYPPELYAALNDFFAFWK